MSQFRRVSAVAISVLLLAATGVSAAPTGDPKLDGAVEKANSEFLTAMKTGDAATIAAPYAERGVFVMPDGSCIQGRNEVEKMYRTGFEKAGLATSTKIESKNVTVDGNVAYESGAAEITVMKQGKPVTRASRYLTVWQRQADGEWKIIRNIVVP